VTGARPALVIGYGNTPRTDDAAGPRAAAVVQGWGLRGVAALAVAQLTPELAESLASARLAVFVDACLAVEDEPSAVEVRPLGPSGKPSAFGHAGDPGRLLALALVVYGTTPPAWLVTVRSADFGLGEGLSPRAERGLEDALTRIADLLRGDDSGIPRVDSRCRPAHSSQFASAVLGQDLRPRVPVGHGEGVDPYVESRARSRSSVRAGSGPVPSDLNASRASRVGPLIDKIKTIYY
jgi:hydrogenase maturation protease